MNTENIIKQVMSSRQILLRNASIQKQALNLLDIMSQTSRRSIKYRKGCHAVMTRATPDIGRWIFSVKCSKAKSKGPYDVRFKLLKGRTKDPMEREIEVSCNCNSWQYNGPDFNSLKNDFNERQYSDGSAPTERDPKKKFWICKHVAACIPIFSKFIIRK